MAHSLILLTTNVSMTFSSTNLDNQSPPVPPDEDECQMAIDSAPKALFSEIVKDKPPSLNNFFPLSFEADEAFTHSDLSTNKIQISSENRVRLYAPWKYSVIVKTMGRSFNHQFLKDKVLDL